MSDLLAACEYAVKKALKAGADEAEVFAGSGRETAVFLQDNDIKIGRTQASDQLGIRAFRKTGLGFSSVNSLDRKRIDSAVTAAVALASTAPRDPANRLADPLPLHAVKGIYDEAAEGFTTEQALKNASTLLREAKAVDPRITVDSGQFESAIGEKAIVTSTGIQASERRSSFDWFVFGMAVDGSEVSAFQYEFDATHQVDEVDVAPAARLFAEKAVGSLGTKKCPSFKGTVIFTPGTVQDLLASTVEAAVDAGSVQRGMSPFAGKLGKPVASTTLTILDDGTLPGGIGSSTFDREGLPHHNLPIVEKGVLRSYLYNTYTANKDKRKSTASADGSARSVPAIGPSNFIIPPGRRPLDDLVADVKQGLLVTRLSAFPEPVSGNFSGVVKGGAYIEKGEIRHPVRETMLSGNLYEMLGSVTALSREQQKIANYFVPHIVLEGGSVTGG